MLRQNMNDMIIQHIGAELKDQADISERVSRAYTQWFQALVVQGTPPPPQPEEESGAAA